MDKIIKTFRVHAGDDVDLGKLPTQVAPVYESKADYRRLLDGHVAELEAQQELLYATRSHALLVIFQAMDTGGKDGAIKHVMSGINPQGCTVHSFSHPTPLELRHDFLWRTTRDLPERGMISIFNRSYYEEVLIVRVHPEILAAEDVHDDGRKKRVWEERFRSINALERHLRHNGTRIVKIFLHISRDEQRRRLLQRIDTPDKQWKISADDIRERQYWKQYQKAYESCLSETSSKEAPWYVVPADDKLNARLFVSQIILRTLRDLELKMPETTPERLKELEVMRKALLDD